jgi:peptide deformylase
MATREILIWPNTTLLQKSVPVTNFGPELKVLLADMKDTVKIQKGLGLAAVQIGVLQKVLLICTSTDYLELINPIMTYSKEKFTFENEGCLSLPGEYFNTERYRLIGIRYQDSTGKELVKDFTDLEAVEMQHELDHLDGKLLIFRPEIGPMRRDIITRRLKKLKKA